MSTPSSSSSPGSASSPSSSASSPTTYHSVLSLLEQEESKVQVDAELIEDLLEKYQYDKSRDSLSTADSLQQYAHALIKSPHLRDHFKGVSLLSGLSGAAAASLDTSAEGLYSFALGLFRVGEYREALVKASQCLENDSGHPRALLLKQLLALKLEEAATRRTLVYLDGQDGGTRAFLTAVQTQQPGEKDHLYLLSVFESAEELVDTAVEGWELLLEDRKGELVERSQQDFVRHCRAKGLRFTSVCGIGSPRETILQLVGTHRIDLLVVGQDRHANVFSKLTGTTLTDSMVANAPCQVLVAKDTYGPARESIVQEHIKASAASAVRPPPPRRAHTQDATPVIPPASSSGLPIDTAQISEQVSKITESVATFFDDIFGEPKTPERPGETSSQPASQPASSATSEQPADSAESRPKSSDRLSLESIKKFGQQLPFFSKPKE